MTDALSDAPLDDERDDVEPEPIEHVETGRDPVTVANTDPAAMSETERNRRLTEQYNPTTGTS